MLRSFTIALQSGLMMFVLLSSSCATVNHTKLKLQAPKDKASYAVGFSIGKGLEAFSEELDLDYVKHGFLHGFYGDTTQQAVMPRPEIFSYMRKAIKRMNDEELEEISKAINLEMY